MIKFKLDDKEYEIEPNYIKKSVEYIYFNDSQLKSIVKYFFDKSDYELDDFLHMDIINENNKICLINNINGGNLYVTVTNNNAKKNGTKKNGTKKKVGK